MPNAPAFDLADATHWRQALRLATAAFALTTLFAVVFTLRTGLGVIEGGATYAWRAELTRVLVHWWASLLFVPTLAMLVRRAPVTQGRWVRHAAILLLGTLVVSGARTLLDPPLAYLLGDEAPTWLRTTRVLAAFGSFLAVVVMLHAVLFYGRMRDREREGVRLAQSLAEAQLAATQARLDALRAQLQPHFLFNALNAIAALMHSDPVAADRMLTRLAHLLRSVLHAPATGEHTLREELQVLDQYLDIMAIRFGPRLRVERVIDASLLDTAVPWLVLQPLAENALEHGLWPRPGGGTLRIVAEPIGSEMRLVVEDDGVGHGEAEPSDADDGIGLENTRRRLAHLHGTSASLTLTSRAEGGTRATIVMPRPESATGQRPHG